MFKDRLYAHIVGDRKLFAAFASFPQIMQVSIQNGGLSTGMLAKIHTSLVMVSTTHSNSAIHIIITYITNCSQHF